MINTCKLWILNHKNVAIILCVVIGLVFFYIFANMRSNNNSESVVSSLITNSDIEVYTENECADEFITVDIKGYVKHPGVYRVLATASKRISDIITMAGGLLNNANTSTTNLAKKVFDEMVIIIYSNDEIQNFTKVKEEEVIKNDKCESMCDSCLSINDNKTNNNALISINTATKEQLMSLPGIGEAKALDIIAYRTEHQKFEKIEDLMNVKGIAESVYDKLKAYITV